MYEKITANTYGKVRHDKLEGRDYIVAPMAMLTEGVHNGSRGRLFYSKEQLSKLPVTWNHKPIVVYHPEMNGQAISACQPSVMESRKVGIILNSIFDDKLRSEAWIEIEKANKVDPRIIISLEKGEMMEVSTGLFTDNIDSPGEFNGKLYDFLATNLRPDHLALLPDKKGACSIADGAGLLQTNTENQNVDLKGYFTKCQELSLNRMSTEKKSITIKNPDGTTQLVANVLSHQDVNKGITQAMMEEAKASETGYWPGYVEDVYDDFYIFSQDGKYFKRGYSTDANYNVRPFGDPSQVQKHSEYRDSNGGHIAPTGKDMSGSRVMPKGTADDQPGGTKEPQSPILVKAGQRQELGGSKAAIGDQGGSGKAFSFNSGESAVMNVDQYVSNAPPEIRDMLTHGLAAHNTAKQALINVIVANKANRFTPEVLKEKKLEELEALAALAAPPPVVNQTRPPNYAGAATAPPAVIPPALTGNTTPTTQAALPPPKWEFENPLTANKRR